MTEWKSAFNNKPSEDNKFYPVLRCFDESEGFFPSCSAYAFGKFYERYVTHFIDEPLDTAEEAEKTARDNDPEW